MKHSKLFTAYAKYYSMANRAPNYDTFKRALAQMQRLWDIIVKYDLQDAFNDWEDCQ